MPQFPANTDRGLVSKTHLDNIGDAIRDKLGTDTEYLPADMAIAIESIVNTYTAEDEGKVVSDGALVAQTARSDQITQNGTYDTTENNSVTVDVAGEGNPFISLNKGDFSTGWYQSRKITRTLEDGPALIAAISKQNNGFFCGAFYTLKDYGSVENVISGDYVRKDVIENVNIPGYGSANVYIYGGMSGAGNSTKSTVMFIFSPPFNFDNTARGYYTQFKPIPVGENSRFGITREENYGTAFSSMSVQNQEEFLTSLLSTL